MIGNNIVDEVEPPEPPRDRDVAAVAIDGEVFQRKGLRALARFTAAGWPLASLDLLVPREHQVGSRPSHFWMFEPRIATGSEGGIEYVSVRIPVENPPARVDLRGETVHPSLADDLDDGERTVLGEFHGTQPVRQNDDPFEYRFYAVGGTLADLATDRVFVHVESPHIPPDSDVSPTFHTFDVTEAVRAAVDPPGSEYDDYDVDTGAVATRAAGGDTGGGDR
jgi:hypothetical protein